MADIRILSNNRDFADALAYAVARELGAPCEVVASLGVSVEVRGVKLAVVLPARLREVLADIEHMLQKKQPFAPVIALGDWQLSPLHKNLGHTPTGADIALTDKEVAILQMLMEAPGKIIDKEQLLKTVWNMDSALDTHTLETHIYRLRNKFRELAEGEVIAGSEGGYKWNL